MTPHAPPPLHAGPVSSRHAYRWLRRCPRDPRDVHLRVCWPVGEPGSKPTGRQPSAALPAATHAALHALPCKTLDDETPGRWLVRTRSWYGRRDSPAARRYQRQQHGAVLGDRDMGLMYARRLAALLRAAWRDGVALWVEAS